MDATIICRKRGVLSGVFYDEYVDIQVNLYRLWDYYCDDECTLVKRSPSYEEIYSSAYRHGEIPLRYPSGNGTYGDGSTFYNLDEASDYAGKYNSQHSTDRARVYKNGNRWTVKSEPLTP